MPAAPTLTQQHPLPSQPVLRLHLLGRLEAWGLGGEAVAPRARKARALLGVLGHADGLAVQRERLADLLWSASGGAQARGSLRQALHELADALAPVCWGALVLTRETAALHGAWTDAGHIAEAWTRGAPPTDSLLDLAARGELMADLNGVDPALDEWLTAERARFRGKVEDLAERRLAAVAGDPPALTAAARRLLALDRAHEGAWRALMRAHLARDERGLALRAYEDCRVALRETLDAQPSAETEALAAEARRRGAAAAAAAAAAPGSAPAGAAAAAARAGGGVRLAVAMPRPLGPGVEDYLPAALAEELSDALARFRWLFVLSPSAVAGCGGPAQASVWRDLALDYLVDGTLARAAGGGLRLTLRLLDLKQDGEIAWTRRIERRDADPASALREDVAADVVAQIDPAILLIESRRAARRPAGDAGAYDHLMRAVPLLYRLDRDSYARAGQHLGRAVALDPEYAASHAWYAFWHVFQVGQAWATPAERADFARRAGELAERAVRLDPEDAMALTISGHVRAFLHGRPEEGCELHDRALSLNPNLASAWALSAATACYLGDAADALRRMSRYKRLAPVDAQSAFFDGVYALAHAVAGAWGEAAEAGYRMLRINPGFVNTRKVLAAALGQLGRLEEAREVVHGLLALEPCFTVEEFLRGYPLRRDDVRRAFAEGLRRAGAPPGG